MDAFFKEEQKKLKALKLSKLKKVGKAREVAEEVMEASIAGVADEDDAKDILIGLIFKAMCLKVAPSPSRERSPKEEDLAMQTCQLCTGCIRFPGHDGPCMDGQCNEIYPDRTDVVTLDMAEEAAAKHREMTQAIMQKLEQKAQEAEEAAAAAARKQAEAEEAARKAAEELKQAEEAARRKAEEDAAAAAAAAAEAAAASAAAEEAAKEAQAKREAQRRAIEREENEMADLCVKTFLGCIRTSKRIHTPIKGTILYTKFIRPCRPVGTSIDVKDSSFRNLRGFLDFLEREGLLRLQPNQPDPVVTAIMPDACARYKYVPRS